MNNFSLNLELLPFIIYLSSKRILSNKLENKITHSKKELGNLIFLDQREYNNNLPNYIHKNYQEFIDQENYNFSIINSLEKIKTYYLLDNLTVKKENFEEWQILITLMNPIHVAGLFFIKDKKYFSIFSSSSLLHKDVNNSVNDFFKRRKFNDLHIHLNGTSEVIFSWQFFLNNPKYIYKQLKFSTHFEQLGFKNIQEIMNLIEIAKYLQENLVYIIINKNHETKICKYTLVEYLEKKDFFIKSKSIKHPIQLFLNKKFNLNQHNISTYELIFITEIYSILEDPNISVQKTLTFEHRFQKHLNSVYTFI